MKAIVWKGAEGYILGEQESERSAPPPELYREVPPSRLVREVLDEVEQWAEEEFISYPSAVIAKLRWLERALKEDR